MGFVKKNIDVILVLVLLVFSAFLRFPNLGYSDYIGDEHKAFIELIEGQTLFDFFMSRRKGPMQFLVSEIPHYFVGNFKNELAQRIPFTIIGLFSVPAFYFLVKQLTKDRGVAFLSALLLSVNGFIVGFSRIAQYQNLNLLFSFLSVYFYAKILNRENNIYVNSFLGTLTFSLSLLSHWDAIFVLPPIVFIFLRFLFEKGKPLSIRFRLIFLNFVLGCLILLPFLVPYVAYQVSDVENQAYFARRVGFGHMNFERYKLLIELYNPFVTLTFLLVCGAVGILFVNQGSFFLIWFVINYAAFELFVRKPGTHIYNFLIPLIILASVGAVQVIKVFPRWFKAIPLLITASFVAFFYYQSYLIFVNHSVEYPWRREEILGKETKRYAEEDKLPLFGFPHSRKWQEINDFINAQEVHDYKYITNEDKTISEWYMDVDYGIDGGFFAIGVKRPLSFMGDYSFTNINGRKHLHSIKDENDETIVKIYVVE